MVKKLGILLIIIGIGITSYPLVSQWVDKYLQDKMLDDMSFLDDGVASDFNGLGSAFDNLNDSGDSDDDAEILIEGYDAFTNSEDVITESVTENNTSASNTQGTTKASPPKVKLKALGRITIPSIAVKMPIVAGTGVEELRRSAGHLTGTDLPGEVGNSVLAGHRGYSSGRLFNRLDELKIGDKIIVKTSKGEFEYEVYENKIVKPTDLSVLNRNNRDKVLTLITCTPMFKSTHRIIIHAVMR